MLIELNKNGLKAISQYPIKVNYDGVSVGEYFADIIVEDKVIIELKASANLVPENILQLQNYLKATNIEVGLLLNFGKKPEIRRKTFHNNLKSF
jgi:GxxExxY protein